MPSGEGVSWADAGSGSDTIESSCIPRYSADGKEGKVIVNMNRIKAAVNGRIPMAAVLSTKERNGAGRARKAK